jgi:hypothetical protein
VLNRKNNETIVWLLRDPMVADLDNGPGKNDRSASKCTTWSASIRAGTGKSLRRTQVQDGNCQHGKKSEHGNS